MRILAWLNEACMVQDMAMPGYRLHLLKGKLAGLWAVSVSGNCRMVFWFEGGRAHDINLIDYHEENSDAYEKPSPSWIVDAI